jgi:hypothetical protein
MYRAALSPPILTIALFHPSRWALRSAVLSSFFRFFSSLEQVPFSLARLDLVRNLA